MAFKDLQSFTAARRKHLPFIASLEDYDILLAIGIAEEEGRPIGFKQLRLLNLASPSTLQRRLRKMMVAGAIRTESHRDGRLSVYMLTDGALRSHKDFVESLLMPSKSMANAR